MAHLLSKRELMEIESRMSFSYGLEASLTAEERKVDKIMKRLKLKVKDEYFNSVIHDYFETKVRINKLAY
jgi:hypothetical protein